MGLALVIIIIGYEMGLTFVVYLLGLSQNDMVARNAKMQKLKGS